MTHLNPALSNLYAEHSDSAAVRSSACQSSYHSMDGGFVIVIKSIGRNGRLEGTYYQAVVQQTFDVYFARN